jgi:demethylmenaquinone methyltransferase / 2-methoxy-6-polyprenyl-1,4-benzoquinol methylase
VVETHTRPTPYNATDKRAAVRAMFDHIAPGYDRVNRWMTFGLDERWRRAAAIAASLPAGGSALDVGTGTGDLAIALVRSQPDATVIGVDYARGMLHHAPAKATRSGYRHQLHWAASDGARLPFRDAVFDAVTSAFVLRNFADLGVALVEMARVLRPGGQLVALEASPGGSKVWRLAVRAHFTLVVPLLGLVFTGDPAAYHYLGASVEAFLSPQAIANQFADAGLRPREPVLLAGGSIVVHRAERPS